MALSIIFVCVTCCDQVLHRQWLFAEDLTAESRHFADTLLILCSISKLT